MFVTVIAMNEGHSGARRAGRFFPNGGEVRLEVVDSEDGGDPPQVKGPGGTMVADPARIGKNSLKAIKDDPRLKLLADGATQEMHSKATYEDAKRLAEVSAGELVGARIEIQRLAEENQILRDRLQQHEGHGHGGKAAKTETLMTPTAASAEGDDAGSHPEKRRK
jgi:hypothetical protein